jgi:hypothetical protein
MAAGNNIYRINNGDDCMNIQQFDYTVNLLQCILWQYDESTKIISLINQKQNWYNNYQTQFWTDWYNNVFNLITANDFGLSVWSYILNIPLYLNTMPEPNNKPIWGFNKTITPAPSYTAENTYLNFIDLINFSNIGSNFSTKNNVITLTLEQQRFLLRLRYFQLTTRGDITDINIFLNYLITTSSIDYTGTLYVLDGLDMSMTYVFTNYDFPPNLFQLLITLDILPRPAGVKLKFVLGNQRIWGFNKIEGTWPTLENTYLNFGSNSISTSFGGNFTDTSN